MQITERNKEIRRLYAEGASQTLLAKKFRMSQATISNIVNSDGNEIPRPLKRLTRADTIKREEQFDIKLNRTFGLLRKKHPYVKGDKVRVLDDKGRYIKATVKQRTEWLIALACEDGLTRTVSFQELAADEDLIKA